MPIRSIYFRLAKCWLCVALTAAVAQKILGCTICIGFPNESLVDRVAQGDCVVLATLSPNDPFAFAPVEILKGDYQGESIDLLVNSTTRRSLNTDDSLRVVLVKSVEDRAWHSLGVVSPAYEQVVRRIAIFSDHWSDSEGRQRRVQFFLPLFGHDDPQIRELAYLELGRAPYSVIKQLGRTTLCRRYQEYLTSRQYVEWRSLAILLLAQSEKTADQRFILDSFHAAERFGITSNLSAWAAAAIELQGVEAIDFIEEQYLSKADRSTEEVEAILRALSLHGSEGNPELRQRILLSYRVLLNNHSHLAALVVRDLTAWKHYDLSPVLSRILTNNKSLDFDGKRLIVEYLRADQMRSKLVIVHE